MGRKKEKLYPDSGVELGRLSSYFYDLLMNILTFGKYHFFIHKAIKDMGLKKGESVLDLGSGSGLNACIMAKYLGAGKSDNNEGKGPEILGLDISDIMLKRFNRRCKKYPGVNARKMRIDVPLPFKEEFDRAFICFVLHGFPFDVEKIIVQNAYNALKRGGKFCILDYNEFEPEELRGFVRWFFLKGECKYAHQFVKRDWKKILTEYGFNKFDEKYYMGKFIRLLCAEKV